MLGEAVGHLALLCLEAEEHLIEGCAGPRPEAVNGGTSGPWDGEPWAVGSGVWS